MKINEVEINNFYSIKHAKVVFDDYEGIVLIEGENRDTSGSNGSGKSAILEAVVWGLFGKTIRKSTEEALVNNVSKKNCSVRVRVNDDIVIERGKKPVFLKVTKGDSPLTQDHALTTQKLINDTLQTDYKVFLASTFYGQQNSMEFISASPDDKRIIIKNFLNMNEMFSLRDSVKKLKSEYSQNIKKQDAIITEHQNSIESYDKQLAYLEELRKAIEDDYSEEALSLSFEDIVDLENKAKEIDRQVEEKENKKNKLYKERTSLEKSPNKICSECNTTLEVLPPGRVKSLLNDKTIEIETLLKDINRLENSYPDIPISSNQYSKIWEYRNLVKESETFEEIKQTYLDRSQAAFNEKALCTTQYEIMRFWEKAFSESGLVKYVIKNILEYFNGKVNFFLSYLSNGKFSIEFDESLKETILNNGKAVHYISLSGGETKKINLAVMLGLQELLKMSHSQTTSIMFFDEVAEFLDEDGISGLYILLSILKKDRTLFVITHNNYLKSLLDNSTTISIIKANGISTIRGK